ncbi:MAG TPA: Gldg family protein, partial [Blastocatellia bacterium]
MPTDHNRRRAVTFASVILYSVIVIAILGVVNFLANRYDKSFDTTSDKKFTLSEQSKKIVKNLKQDVTIAYWDRPDAFTRARDLFDRYKGLSPHVNVQYNDPDKKFAQAKAAGVTNYGNIFVEVGNKKVEAKSLTEEDVTGALVKALKGGDREVCFVLGSGEHSADSTDRDGYSQAKEAAEKSSYKTQTIKLIPKSEIPTDCTVVVVPGPKLDYVQPEAD